ncbi:MAG: heme o synthase [Methylacidiphilales bacterium]|nr:heme o synthase [Candidatus Methylacidiphilales bacterium]
MIRPFLDLIKLRVVSMLVFTAWAGMIIAVLHNHLMPSMMVLVYATIGIFFASSSSACLNQIFERYIDERMKRTALRPLPTGSISPFVAIVIAIVLFLISMGVLYYLVNPITCLLTLFSFIFYSFIYTLFLKKNTAQNIVIGGLAGALPPLLGWTAVTGTIDPFPLLLTGIIFIWTPSHFWALSVARRAEYATVGLPMLPVMYGVPFTKAYVLLYSILLVVVSLLPWIGTFAGIIYCGGAIVLGVRYLYLAFRLYAEPADQDSFAMPLFRFSIQYIMYLFAVLVLDKIFSYLFN